MGPAAWRSPLGAGGEARSFAVAAVSPCLSYAAMLLAIESEFEWVEPGTVDQVLDEAALPLFEVAGAAPTDQLRRLRIALERLLAPADDEPEALLVGRALRRGLAHPIVRAAIAADVAERAGIDARLMRSGARWLVGVNARGKLVTNDLGGDSGSSREQAGRPCALCPHEVAFAVLSRLAQLYRAADRRGDARRAAGLRLLLPIDPELRARLLDELTSYA